MEAPQMVDVGEVAAKERLPVAAGGLGFERVDIIPGSTYRDNSTVVVVPLRDRMVDFRVIQSWEGLIGPMNGKKAKIYAYGDEVGIAYNNMISNILANPELSKWKYVLTLESDNLPPPDAHIRLLESIEIGKYDAVSGLYFTKGPVNMPMAYGDPAEFNKTGVLDFRPRSVADAIKAGQLMEVNGIAMGCSLYRMELFRQIPHPWFVSVSDMVEGKGAMGFTQDLFFCEKARRIGKRFAVDMRVKVGHLDFTSGIVY